MSSAFCSGGRRFEICHVYACVNVANHLLYVFVFLLYIYIHIQYESMNPSSPQYWYHDYLVIIGFNPMLAGSFIIFHPYSSPICSMFALQPVLNNHASWKSPYEISIFFQLVPILNHDFSVGRPHILTSCQTCPSDGIRMRRCSTFWCVWSRGSW